jgi:hypothetical protein
MSQPDNELEPTITNVATITAANDVFMRLLQVSGTACFGVDLQWASAASGAGVSDDAPASFGAKTIIAAMAS